MTARWLAACWLLAATPSQAAWLAVCGGAPPSPQEAALRPPGGASKYLRLGEQRPGKDCEALSLPLTAKQVRWVTPIAAEQAARLADARSLVLQGTVRGKQFSGEISLVPKQAPPPQAPSMLPLFLDLKAGLTASVFGQEERASLEQTPDQWRLHCRAGASPAGVVLRHGAGALPPLAGLGLTIAYQGKGAFTWSASALSSPSTDPLPLTEIADSAGQRALHIALPNSASGAWDSWTLSCPAAEASLTLHGLQLTAPPGTPRQNATWLWRADRWRHAPDTLLQSLGKLGIGTLYVTVPLTPDWSRVADAERLRAFVSKASARGIAVWAVDGDPAAVLETERPAWRKRAQAYAAYNRTAPAPSRLRGVQYDIEPYLLPGYGPAWQSAYLETLAALRQASPLPLEAAIPYWWAGEMLRDAPLLEALAPLVDGLTVMDYSTDPRRIQQQALPFLDWGRRFGKPVRIALEAGPVSDDDRFVFHPTPSGDLWQLKIGDTDVLLRREGQAANPHGAAYSLTTQTVMPGERVSFHRHRDRLTRILPELERSLGAWPSFAGLALHELLR